MAWIEVHQSLPTHRKTLAAADALDLSPAQLVGHIVCLWLWAIDNAPDGHLNVSVRTVARAAQWDGDPQAFVDALTAAGFLEDGMLIHDYEDYIGKLIDRRKANADRMAARRHVARAQHAATTKEDTSRARAQHVLNTNATRAPATEHNRTVHNPSGSPLLPPAPEPEAAPAEPAAARATPKPNKYGDFIDALTEADVPYAPNERDARAVNKSRLTAAQIAECYLALARDEWGDGWMRDRLSAQTAANVYNAYLTFKTLPAARNGRSRDAPPTALSRMKAVMDWEDGRNGALAPAAARKALTG